MKKTGSIQDDIIELSKNIEFRSDGSIDWNVLKNSIHFTMQEKQEP